MTKDKEHGLLQAELFVKKNEWNKLEDELLANKALINRMNRPKGGLDHYYCEVNNSGYGIGFDLALDGLYDLDKIEGLNELIPGVGNIEFIDPKKIDIDEEKDYIRRSRKEEMSYDEEFLDGEKVDAEIICESRLIKKYGSISDIDEYYINEFFKNGGPRNVKVYNGFSRKNQYYASTSRAKPHSGRVYLSHGYETFDMGKVSHNSHQNGPINQKCMANQGRVNQNGRATNQRRGNHNGSAPQYVHNGGRQQQNRVNHCWDSSRLSYEVNDLEEAKRIDENKVGKIWAIFASATVESRLGKEFRARGKRVVSAENGQKHPGVDLKESRPRKAFSQLRK